MPENKKFTDGRPKEQPGKNDVPPAEAEVLESKLSGKDARRKLATDGAVEERSKYGSPAPSPSAQVTGSAKSGKTGGVPPPPSKGPIRSGGLAGAEESGEGQPSGKSHL